MYTYYCLKIIHEDNSCCYFYMMNDNGTPMTCGNINDSRFFKTAAEAYELYNQVFRGRVLSTGGVKIARCSVVEVKSQFPI